MARRVCGVKEDRELGQSVGAIRQKYVTAPLLILFLPILSRNFKKISSGPSILNQLIGGLKDSRCS